MPIPGLYRGDVFSKADPPQISYPASLLTFVPEPREHGLCGKEHVKHKYSACYVMLSMLCYANVILKSKIPFQCHYLVSRLREQY